MLFFWCPIASGLTRSFCRAQLKKTRSLMRLSFFFLSLPLGSPLLRYSELAVIRPLLISLFTEAVIAIMGDEKLGALRPEPAAVVSVLLRVSPSSKGFFKRCQTENLRLRRRRWERHAFGAFQTPLKDICFVFSAATLFCMARTAIVP